MDIFKIIQVAIAVLLIIFFVHTVSGRAGGAGPSRSSRDGGGGDGIGELIYIIIWILINVPFPFNLIIIGIILFFAVQFSRHKKHAYQNDHSAFRGNELSGPKSKDLDKVLAKLAYFDKDKFLQNARKSFINIQKAWASKNIADIRNLISDGVYQRFVTQVEMMGLLKQKNKLDKIELYNAWIDRVTPSKIYDIIHIGFGAHIKDQFVSELSRSLYSGGEGSFTEYWTFIRKKDIQTKDLFNADSCPNCGAPLEKKATDIAKCDYCNTILNSGEYDWVLSEITQAEDYNVSNYSTKKLQALNLKVEKLMQKDPGFCVQKLTDKASNAYLQVMSAKAFTDPVKIRRFVTDKFLEKFKSSLPEKQIVFNRLYLNSVDLIAIGETGDKNYAAVSVKSSYQRVVLSNNRIERILDKFVYSKNETLIFHRDKDIKDNNASLYAHACPNCAAPVLDTLDINCQYCSEPLNSPRREWILDDILSPVEYRNFIGENTIRKAETVKPEIIDDLYNINDYVFNNIMMIIAADGIFHDKEREFAVNLAKKYGYPDSNIFTLFQLANTRKLSIKMPDSPSKRKKVYTLMKKAAMADGHIAKAEKELLDDVCRSYDIEAA